MSANLLFVDQPVGTGFSNTVNNSFVGDLNEMANQFLSFLDRYVDVFPELLDNDIYSAGESFAGQYIPFIAKDILIKRSMLKLRGLLIGNGWIDPVTHYESYLPFTVAKNLVKANSTFYNDIANDNEKCQQVLSNKVLVLEETCSSILYGIVECNVRSRIHVDHNASEWEMCVESATRALAKTESEPCIQSLPDLLRQVPILLYNSEYDLICNHWAIEKMMDNNTWNNRTGFDLGNGTLVPLDPWFADDDEPVGLIRTARNLSYILFYKAGHAVPYNYPRRSLAMLNPFMQLKLYSDAYQTRKRNTFKKMITSNRDVYQSSAWDGTIPSYPIRPMGCKLFIFISWDGMGWDENFLRVVPSHVPWDEEILYESILFSKNSSLFNIDVVPNCVRKIVKNANYT
ncbi:unnamed protein product [Rotaria magnacalcarata]|uniref:Pheromone-processing carboxypeptidase KEX1 n=3 Tax=Rotaria magnacalcarata TaxID=392030 RepID=A0A816L2W8_9BILA|nr:unnamed protein product [Rotaria magnacalcarata]